MSELEPRDKVPEHSEDSTTAYTTTAVGVALLVAAVLIIGFMALGGFFFWPQPLKEKVSYANQKLAYENSKDLLALLPEALKASRMKLNYIKSIFIDISLL